MCGVGAGADFGVENVLLEEGGGTEGRCLGHLLLEREIGCASEGRKRQDMT